MERDDYLQVLRDNLTYKTDDEKDDIIRNHLQQMINSGDDQAMMEAWGRPEARADQICGTHNYQGDTTYYRDYSAGAETKSNKKWLKFGVGIAASPFAFLLSILVFVLIITMYSVAFGILVGGIALHAAAIFCFVIGVLQAASGVAELILFIGAGLVLSGMGKLFCTGGVLLGKAATKLIKKIFKELFNKED